MEVLLNYICLLTKPIAMAFIKLFKQISLQKLVVLFSLSFLFFSCRTQRIAYFKDIPDNVKVKYVDLPNFAPPVVHSDDILNIVVQTLDPQANPILNQGNLPILSGVGTTGAGSSANQQAVSGYLVSKEGNIHMPYIGLVHVTGQTTEQIRDTISARMSKFFVSPVVSVRFANFKVTVLGEVRNPTTFSIANEKPTVIDAIGMAGDITIYGRHDNVMLIRDNNGKKEITRLNLDNSSVLNSPFFYLRPNDVIYVEPTANRVESTDAYRTKYLTLLASGLTIVVFILSRVVRI